MNVGLISVRYASALLDYAYEKKAQKEVYDEAKLFISVSAEITALQNTLDNPIMSVSEKKQLIVTAFGGSVSTVMNSIIDLVLDNNRETQFRYILLSYIDLYRTRNNIKSGRLITAVSLEDKVERRITKIIEKDLGGHFELEKIVDTNTLGGFILEVDNYRWDASISGQLNRIKNEYIEKNRRII